MYICIIVSLSCSVRRATVERLVWLIVYSEGRLIVFRSVFRRAWKFFRNIYPLCYKQEIALSPRKIKDKISLVFSKRYEGKFVKTLKTRVKFIINSTRPHANTYTNFKNLTNNKFLTRNHVQHLSNQNFTLLLPAVLLVII